MLFPENAAADPLAHPDQFVRRHIGPDAVETSAMLALLGHPTLDGLIDAAVPPTIRLGRKLNLPAARSEYEALAELRRIAQENQIFRSFIGQGYYDTITPPVIQRNVLENPGWYTPLRSRARSCLKAGGSAPARSSGCPPRRGPRRRTSRSRCG